MSNHFEEIDSHFPGLRHFPQGYDMGQDLVLLHIIISPINIATVQPIFCHDFEGAELRHPVGSRRQASIAGKYGGGVFCNLPDGTVCMCSYG